MTSEVASAHEFVGRAWTVSRCLAELEQTRPAVLVIGQPGSGKTALAREVYERLSTRAGDDQVVVLHECHANDDATLLPWRLIDRLVAALSAHSQPYALAVAEAMSLTVTIDADIFVESAIQSQISAVVINSIQAGSESARSVFTRLVRAPLESIDRPPTVVLIVDGLDEANSPSLAGEFGNLLRHTVTSLASSPLDVRFWLSCRTAEHAAFAQVATAVVNLDTDEPADSQDMVAYCMARLAGTDSADADDLARTVAAKASGNYLYAKYAIALTRGPAPTRRVADLPAGLDEIYAEFLRRRVAYDLSSSAWRTRYRPFLGLIAVAREPGVTAGDLAWILRLDDATVGDTLDDLSEFLRLDPQRRTWSIFHDSFRNFLLTTTTLRISAREAHRVAGEHFLAAGPGSAGDYLLRNFAYHLHGAGLHAELCAYVISPERWREHERHAGASLALRTSTLSTARDSALLLNDPGLMAALLLHDIELRLDASGADTSSEPADGTGSDVLVQIGNYDVTVLWQLVTACQALESGNRAVAANRLDWMEQRCGQQLHPDWQYQAAGLLAHLRVTFGADGPATELSHRLLDDLGAAFQRRFLLERGAVASALTGPDIRDSERYRHGLFRFAIDLAEKRRDADAAVTVARHVAAIPRQRHWSPTVWEDVSFGAALAWIPRNHAGDLTALLHRVRRAPVIYADVLAALGRPQVSGDAPRRRHGMRLLAEAQRHRAGGPTGFWIDYHAAVALRRDGDLAAARAWLRALRVRLPALDSPPDNRFVAEVHLDAVHGPCLQGLVFLLALESATARDFAQAEDLTAELLRFGSGDGASALVHLITEMGRAGEPARLIQQAYARLSGLLVRHLSGFEAGMQQFCVATALRDLLGLSNGYAEQVRRGLTMIIESLHRMAAATNRPYSRPVVHALAASLAHTFNERAGRRRAGGSHGPRGRHDPEVSGHGRRRLAGRPCARPDHERAGTAPRYHPGAELPGRSRRGRGRGDADRLVRPRGHAASTRDASAGGGAGRGHDRRPGTVQRRLSSVRDRNPAARLHRSAAAAAAAHPGQTGLPDPQGPEGPRKGGPVAGLPRTQAGCLRRVLARRGAGPRRRDRPGDRRAKRRNAALRAVGRVVANPQHAPRG